MKKLLLFVIACTLGLFGTVNAQEETAADSVVLAAPVVVVDTTTATTVTLVWNVVENATSYNVYSDTLLANVTDTVYTVDSLTAETDYTFTVKALADTLESAASEAVTAKTLAAEPTEPGDGEEGEGDEPTEPEFNGYRLESVATSWSATAYEYDGANRVVAIDEDGLMTKVSYNEDGQITKAVASYEEVDTLGNPVEVILSGVEYAYDTTGKWVSYSEIVDRWGQLVTEETVLGYDSLDRIVSLTSSSSYVRTIAYNKAGLISEVFEGYATSTEEDEEGEEGEEEGDDNGIAPLSEEDTLVISYEGKITFEYDSLGRLAEKSYYSYDAYETQEFHLSEAEVYAYDSLGNCVSKKAYLAETEDEEGNLTLNSFPYSVTEYYYDVTINNEDVYSFEYPHFVFMNYVEPSYVNILLKEYSYYSYFDEELGEIVDNSFEATIYNYNPEVLSAPLTPMNLTAEVTSATEIELAWAAFADAESFIIYSADTVYATTEESPFVVDSLELGVEYCFSVVAVNAVDTTEASNTACATIELPAAPANLVAKATSDTTIDLSWDEVEGVWNYNVYMVTTAEDSTTAYELVGEAWWTEYTVEGLTADTEYSFVVKSLGVAGESEASNVATAKTNEEGVEILFSEDFENYEVGAKIAETNPEYWTTWNDKPGTKEDGAVAEKEGNKYGHMTHGVDQVLLLGGYQTGVYELEFDIYIPENKGAYFNILHDFHASYSTWALQAYLQMTDDGQGNPTISAGHSAVHAGGSNAADIPTVWNGWMHFRVVIDANTDNAKYYYTLPNGEETMACEWQWSKDSFGEGSVNRKLDAMNFFPPNNKSEFYIDNLLLKRTGAEVAVALGFDTEKVEASKNTNDMTTVDFTVENTGEAVVDYTAWIDYGMGEMSDKYEVVSYSLEDLSTTTAIGWSNTTEPMTFELAALYPASAYANAVMGTYITDVAYLLPEFKNQEDNSTVPMLEPGTDMIFRIYEQGFNGYPGRVLAEKVLPADSIIFDWNTVTFDEPIALTGYDFYFAIEMTQCVGGAPMVLDGNTDASLAGYADLCRLSNTTPFVSLTDYTSGETFGNWHLVVVCSGDPVLGGWAELGTKEGTLAIGANETIDVNISTFGLTPGETYEAKIVFNTNPESESIELPLSLYIWGEDVEEILSNTYNIYPNPTTAQVTVEGENINYIAVYNSVGQLVKVVRTQNNVVDMSANENGVYFFNIVDNAGQSSVQRVVVAK